MTSNALRTVSSLALPRMPVYYTRHNFHWLPVACVRSESDENGAILKPTWHDQTLDSDIFCSFSKQLIRWEWSNFETHMTVIRLTVTSRSVLSQSNWSDENGAVLKPTWHNQTLDSDIMVCSFSKQLIIYCVVMWLLNYLWPFVGVTPATRNTRTVKGLYCRTLVVGVGGITIHPSCPCPHFKK